MILAIGFLLLVSLAVSAALAAFGDALEAYLPDFLSSYFVRIVGLLLSLMVITGLFASLYKVLPDAKVHWRDVLTGAAVTSLLFVLGKYLLGVYLGAVMFSLHMEQRAPWRCNYSGHTTLR